MRLNEEWGLGVLYPTECPYSCVVTYSSLPFALCSSVPKLQPCACATYIDQATATDTILCLEPISGNNKCHLPAPGGQCMGHHTMCTQTGP